MLCFHDEVLQAFTDYYT